MGRHVYQAAFKELKAKEISTASLYALSTLTIFIVSTIGLFIPGLPAVTEAAPLVLGFWHLGEAIEHSLVKRIKHKLDVRATLPKAVRLQKAPGKQITIAQLKINDEFLLEKGETIPVDGILLRDAKLYTTRINGSPKLQQFRAGDQVYSGMQLPPNATAEIRATKCYQDSYLSLIAQNIDKALESKAPIELVTKKILQYFVPGLIAIALLSGLLVSTFVSPAAAFSCVISVLISACPCVLSLITPLAVKIGLKKGSEYGVQYKNGRSLQRSANIDAVVFDLNGTLTQGKLSVGSCLLTDKKFARYISALELQSEHPTATVITQYLQSKSIKPLPADALKTVDKSFNNGISASVEGKKLLVGNRDFLRKHGIKEFHPPFDDPANGNTFAVFDKKVVGKLLIHDPLRSDAIATIKELKRQGKEVFLCTGTDELSAQFYAKVLKIPFENISANNVSPTAKQDFIKELQAKGHNVAMIGDATNDLTAIAQAHLGIAVHSKIGDELTQDYADIVVQQGHLLPIAGAFEIGQQTKRSIVQNLCISLGYNSLVTLVGAGALRAFGFVLNPILGVGLMVLESSVVLGNIVYLKHQKVTAHSRHRNYPQKSLQSTKKALSGLSSNDIALVSSKTKIAKEVSRHVKPLFMKPKIVNDHHFGSPNDSHPNVRTLDDVPLIKKSV